MSKKTKIITVSTSGFRIREGISTVLLDYYNLFDRECFDIDLVVSGEYDSALIDNFQKIGVSIRYLPDRKKKLKNYICGLYLLLKEKKYDTIYVHGSSALMFIELGIAVLCGIKKRVVHSHNTTCDHKTANRMLKPFFNRCYTDALACGNEAGRWLYNEKPFIVIKNGRDVDTYCFDRKKRERIRNALRLKEKTLVIGHVGNFNDKKNQHYLFQVLIEVMKRYKDVKLYFMGDGPNRVSVETEFQKAGLEGNVAFTGSISNISEMLQAMDVMVLPSIHEGLPLVVIEWQIAGLPCIVSNKVTQECAYSALVHFLPLENNEVEWANLIIKLGWIDRDANSKEIKQLTKRSGFDLKDNVEQLETILSRF